MKAAGQAKSILSGAFPKTELVRRLWLARKDPWFLRGAYLEPSSYGDDSIVLSPLLMALFVPAHSINFALPDALGAPRQEAWPRPAATNPESLIAAAHRILPWLERYQTPHHVAGAVLASPTVDPYSLEVAHAALVLEQDLSAARTALDRLETVAHTDAPPWTHEILERARALHALAGDSSGVARAQIIERRSNLLRDLKLERYLSELP
jgi:hypothetical protein